MKTSKMSIYVKGIRVNAVFHGDRKTAEQNRREIEHALEYFRSEKGIHNFLAVEVFEIKIFKKNLSFYDNKKLILKWVK